MGAESKVLFILKSLAAQNPAVLAAIEELSTIKSAAAVTAEYEAKNKSLTAQHEDILNGHAKKLAAVNAAVSAAQSKHDELVAVIRSKIAEGDRAAINARAEAQRITDDAQARATQSAQAAQAAAAKLIADTKASLEQTTQAVVDKSNELVRLNGELSHAQDSLKKIHQLIDAVRPKA